MLQQFDNALAARVSDFSHRIGWLNALITVIATHWLSHSSAQGCTYGCGLICVAKDICPYVGELTQKGSNNLDCSPPYCFLFTNTCC